MNVCCFVVGLALDLRATWLSLIVAVCFGLFVEFC